MNENRSEGNRKRWAKVSPEERSKIMSKTVSARHAKLSKKARKAIGIGLVKARRRLQRKGVYRGKVNN